MRGPGVPAGAVTDSIALNIDFAPTFAELTGVSPADFVDGRSLVPLLDGDPPAEWRHGFLVEHYGRIRPDQWGAPESYPWRRHRLSGRARTRSGGCRPRVYRALSHRPIWLYERSSTFTWSTRTESAKLYDMQTDPYQLQNLAATADPALLADLAARLDQLRVCAGCGPP